MLRDIHIGAPPCHTHRIVLATHRYSDTIASDARVYIPSIARPLSLSLSRSLSLLPSCSSSVLSLSLFPFLRSSRFIEARCRGWENGWRRHICGGVGSEGNHEWRERQPVGGQLREHGKREEGGRGREKERVYADIRVSPVTAILRKTFDSFAHAE